MGFKDQQNHYGRISRFNHWFGALVVIGLLAVGLYFNDMPRGDEKSYWLGLHIAMGGLLFVFLIFRVLWRLVVQSPQAFEQPRTWQLASRFIHGLLLTAVLVMAISGPFLIWTRGSGIAVFDWFTLPSPIGKMPELHEWLETVHMITAKVLLFAISVHVLAALKHQFIDRNQLLSRMVKFLRRE